MNKFLRMTSLGATVAALTLTAAPAIAAPVAANPVAQGRVNIQKALTLEGQADLDFGTVSVSGNGTASMDASGNISCTAFLACAATGTPALYKVTGSNNQVVNINKPDATLTNTDGSGATLTLHLAGQNTVTLPNSGAAGTTFTLGGSVDIAESTRDGLYEGDLNVTVNY